MTKTFKKFMETETKSRAFIIDSHHVEIKTPDGEVFSLSTNLDKYESEEYKDYVLHLIEFIFDKNFSVDKEKMVNRIWRDFMLNSVHSMGISQGSYQDQRTRLGNRIRELREKNGMEAKDLALLAGIDAANLSRIEQGKYSTGVDILSRIAVILDAHLDLVSNE